MLRPYWALHSLPGVHGNLCATQFPICLCTSGGFSAGGSTNTWTGAFSVGLNTGWPWRTRLQPLPGWGHKVEKELYVTLQFQTPPGSRCPLHNWSQCARRSFSPPVVNNELAIVGCRGSAGKVWRRSDERRAVVSCAEGLSPASFHSPGLTSGFNIPLSLHGGGAARDEISAGLWGNASRSLAPSLLLSK